MGRKPKVVVEGNGNGKNDLGKREKNRLLKELSAVTSTLAVIQEWQKKSDLRGAFSELRDKDLKKLCTKLGKDNMGNIFLDSTPNFSELYTKYSQYLVEFQASGTALLKGLVKAEKLLIQKGKELEKLSASDASS